MIVISSSLVISESDLTPDHPVVGYRNIVTTGNITAESVDPLYPETNLANPATHLKWRSVVSGTQYLTIIPNSADPIDYVGIAKHNFADAGIAVSVEVDSGEGYSEVVSMAPGANTAQILRFSPVSCQSIRLKLWAGSLPPELAVLYIGKLLVLPTKIWQGHTPITYGRRQTVINGMSESGNFLGRIITGEWRETKQLFTLIQPGDYRDDVDDFFAEGKDTPFFFGWRPQTYPYEVGYAWLTNNPAPKNSAGHGLTEFELQLSAVA
jgi:hypothetical protein